MSDLTVPGIGVVTPGSGESGCLLVSEVIDRTFSEWLYPAGVNRPAQEKVTPAITSTSALTFNIEGARIAQLPRDSLVEINDEVMSIKSFASPTATVWERGYLETTPATHPDGSILRLNPDFFRVTILNALKGLIGQLYGWGVYRRVFETATLYSSRAPIALPTGTKDVRSIRVRRSSSLRYGRPLKRGIDFDVTFDTDPPELQLFHGGAEGSPMRMVLSKEIGLPATTADDLCALGVSTSLQPGLPMGIAGNLLQGREIPRLNIEEIRRQLAAQGAEVPPGVTFNVSQALIQSFKQQYIVPERNRLAEVDPTRWEYVP